MILFINLRAAHIILRVFKDRDSYMRTFTKIFENIHSYMDYVQLFGPTVKVQELAHSVKVDRMLS